MTKEKFSRVIGKLANQKPKGGRGKPGNLHSPMTLECKQRLEYLGDFTGLVAVLALYYGSSGVPWGRQSWGGNTPEEVAHKRRQRY